MTGGLPPAEQSGASAYDVAVDMTHGRTGPADVDDQAAYATIPDNIHVQHLVHSL